LARIAGIDIPRDKKVVFALRYIYGIGLTKAKAICAKAKVDENIRVKDLKENQVISIRDAIDKLEIKIEGQARSEMAMNIKRLKDVGSYKGIRHRRGLPANGQRTKTNARTRKGKKKTIGMSKKEE